MKKANIRGIIGLDVTAEGIEKELKEANGDSIEFSVSSPGGYIYQGIEIYNLIKKYPGDIKMHISGLAGSMASYIALAGKEKPTVENNSVFFIHNAQGVAIGDHNVMFKFGKMLEGLSNILAQKYAIVSKKKKEEIKKMMDDETEMIGSDIVKQGFASGVIGEAKLDKDALALAQLEMEECKKFMKEHKMDESEIDKIAALFVPEITAQSPADNAGKNILGGVKMTLDELKAQHPDLYNQIFKAGVEAERKRVLAHVTMCKTINDPEMMSKNIESGASMSDEDVMAGYMSAKIKAQALGDRAGDNPPDVKLDPKAEAEKKEEAIQAEMARLLEIEEVK